MFTIIEWKLKPIKIKVDLKREILLRKNIKKNQSLDVILFPTFSPFAVH